MCLSYSPFTCLWSGAWIPLCAVTLSSMWLTQSRVSAEGFLQIRIGTKWSRGAGLPMLKTHFKGESETQKMLNLKDFGGHTMNWNIGVLAEGLANDSLFPPLSDMCSPPVLSHSESDCPPGQESLGGFQVRVSNCNFLHLIHAWSMAYRISKHFIYEALGKGKER